MKKFLMISSAMFLFILALSRGSIQRGFEKVFSDEYFSRVSGNSIELKVDGSWKNFNIKGVNLGAVKPGIYETEARDYMIKEDYLRWISYIGDMNANVIRVNKLMPRSFYEALEEYNEEREEKIYILQGIYFNENIISEGTEIHTEDFDKDIKDTIKETIDYVHGNEYTKKFDGDKDAYDIDISNYVIGYTVGAEWKSEDIIYHEIMDNTKSFNGKFFQVKEGASEFESYLCYIADYLVSYESKKYSKQSLVTFVGTSPYKVLLGDEFEDETIEEEDKRIYKNYVDVENIQATKNLQTGIFVSYNISPNYSDLLEYENNEDVFLKKINDYHSIPVVISEYGVPSSRTIGNYTTVDNKTYISEEEQAELLKNNYEIIKSSECAGSFINSFQDSWMLNSWNNKKLINTESLKMWNNLEGFSNSLGLLSFDLGEESTNLYVDDSDNEWNEADKFIENEDITISSKQDEEYIYFYIKNKYGQSLKDNQLFLYLDVTPKSGTNISNEYSIAFDRNVDFLIRLNGENDSEVLVQDYYNSNKFLNNQHNLYVRPDILPVSKDSNEFSTVELNTSPKIYLDKYKKFADEEHTKVGKLIYGNSNPNGVDYNSVADFYYGVDYIECRVAWSLLNFMDPSTNKIQDDFYESFSINNLEIEDIYVGANIIHSNGAIQNISSNSLKLNKWERPIYHERLKKSYYTMKEVFSE